MSSAMPLTVLCGLDRDAAADVATGLLLRAARTAVVWVDPFTAELGFVQCRVTDSDGRCTERSVALEHGCLSCAMREAVVEAVRRLRRTRRYDALVVHLHPGVEADAAVQTLDTELTGEAVVDTVVAVLHEGWLDDLAESGDVSAKGIGVTSGDARSVAMVLAAALDTASVVVLPATVRDRLCLEGHATLSTLCPDAIRLYPESCLDVSADALLRTGSFDPVSRTTFGRRGLLDPDLVLPDVSGALRLVRWGSRSRPVHPQRLDEALGLLADGVFRSGGHLWVATHPDAVVQWYSAGDCLALGPAGGWPGAGRSNQLAFLGEEIDPRYLAEVLDTMLLTDAELAAGPAACALPDPFSAWRSINGERGAA